MSFADWFKQTPQGVERAERFPGSRFSAYYWSGGPATAYSLKDVSSTGAYLCTAERWCVGTIIALTLQRKSAGTEAAESIAGPCRVVRHGPDGLGVTFMFDRKQDRKTLAQFLSVPRERPRVNRSEQGQSLVEFALMVPLLLILIVCALNFGGFIYSWITVADAARAAVQYAALGTSSADYPVAATVADITALVRKEAASLPGYSTSNPTVTVCQNNNGTVTQLRSAAACPAGVSAIPQDPEIETGTATYASVAVDVTYTYAPFINVSSFLGRALGLPPTTVHRRAVMRILN